MVQEKTVFFRLLNRLGKLQRNMQQMTPTQLVQYKNQLRKLRKEIIHDAEEAVREFLLSGWYISDSAKQLAEQTEYVCSAPDAKKTIHAAVNVLFSTYDISRFLAELLPLKNRLKYEIYGPYWLQHCKPTGDPVYPYQNELTDMFWIQDLNLWMEQPKGVVAKMLPPTEDMLQKEYEEVKKECLKNS